MRQTYKGRLERDQRCMSMSNGQISSLRKIHKISVGKDGHFLKLENDYGHLTRRQNKNFNPWKNRS
jgi:hypothetical protein